MIIFRMVVVGDGGWSCVGELCVCVGGGGAELCVWGGCGRSAHYHGSIMLTVAP